MAPIRKWSHTMSHCMCGCLTDESIGWGSHSASLYITRHSCMCHGHNWYLTLDGDRLESARMYSTWLEPSAKMNN